MRDAGGRELAVVEWHALVLRGARRAQSVRRGLRLHRGHDGAGAIPRSHQTIPLSKS